MDYSEESRQAGRHLMPDLVRAFAIIGIALVNVSVIAYSMDLSYFDGGYRTALDGWAHFLINAIFTSKSYTLFSFMFGVGFAYQIKSADRAGASFTGRYFRRIIGLLILGFLHIALAFPGDILVMYALLGAVLYLFRNTGTKALVVTSFVFIGLQVLIVSLAAIGVQLGMQFAPEEMSQEVSKMQELAAHSMQVFGDGTFAQSVAYRIEKWLSMVVVYLFMQGFGVIGAFLLGLAAVKSDLIANPGAKLWKTFRRVFLPIGLAGSIIAAYLMMTAEEVLSAQMMWGMALLFAAAPLSSAGYLGLIAKWVEGPASGLKTFMARGGTATLTAYLMQSLLLSFIFNNYGLGLYAQLGAAKCIAIALAVALFTLVFSSLWRKKFSRGPMEAVLRRWTYLGAR